MKSSGRQTPVRAMNRSVAFHLMVAVMVLSSGTVNTLAMKWADRTSASGQKGVYEERLCDSLFGLMPCPNRTYSKHQSYVHIFDHPIFQTLCMFLGEAVCFLMFKLSVRCSCPYTEQVERESNSNVKRPYNPVILLFPACCDLIGSGIGAVGLTLTSASSVQMLRASLIIFTGLLAVTFLDRRLRPPHYLGVCLVTGGLVVVGLADFLHPHLDEKGNAARSEVTGDFLIVIAQVIFAVQVTFEEYLIRKYKVSPLQLVGWEGMWGFGLLALLLIPCYFTPVSFTNLRPKAVENTVDALIQVSNSWKLALSVCGLIVSVAVFNSSGVIVSKDMGATTRVVLENVRTLFVWVVSLAVGWEKFDYLQVIGFLLLVTGAVIYYNIIFEIAPFLSSITQWQESWKKQFKEHEPLLIGDDSQDRFGIGESASAPIVLDETLRNPPIYYFHS